MSTLLEQARSQSKLILDFDEEDLFAELGAAVERTCADPEAESQVESLLTESVDFDAMQSLGKKLFRRVSGQFHQLVCDGDKDDEEDRNKILSALKLGDRTEIVAVVTVVLVGSLGLSGVTATLITTIVTVHGY